MRVALPAFIRDAPELDDGLQFYWHAFFDLSWERPVGFSPGPIPRAAILAYAAQYGVERDEVDDFLILVRALDDEWLSYNAEQAEVKSKQSRRKPRVGRKA